MKSFFLYESSNLLSVLIFSFHSYVLKIQFGIRFMNAFPSTTFMRYITLTIIIIILLFAMRINAKEHSLIETSTINIRQELPVYCVNTDKKVVALTFDSAWGTEDLEEILSILKKHNASATFFVTGQWAKEHPDAILSISGAGHEIGNHGMNHKHMPQLSASEMQDEIQQCEDAVYRLTSQKMTLFRAPYSDWNDEVVSVAKQMNYMSINQSVDSLDWKDYGVESIIDTVCNHKNLENGSIILLHNGSTYTHLALDALLTNLEKQGYSFVLVSDLIYTKDYKIDHTGKQFSN